MIICYHNKYLNTFKRIFKHFSPKYNKQSLANFNLKSINQSINQSIK